MMAGEMVFVLASQSVVLLAAQKEDYSVEKMVGETGWHEVFLSVSMMELLRARSLVHWMAENMAETLDETTVAAKVF